MSNILNLVSINKLEQIKSIGIDYDSKDIYSLLQGKYFIIYLIFLCQEVIINDKQDIKSKKNLEKLKNSFKTKYRKGIHTVNNKMMNLKEIYDFCLNELCRKLKDICNTEKEYDIMFLKGNIIYININENGKKKWRRYSIKFNIKPNNIQILLQKIQTKIGVSGNSHNFFNIYKYRNLNDEKINIYIFNNGEKINGAIDGEKGDSKKDKDKKGKDGKLNSKDTDGDGKDTDGDDKDKKLNSRDTGDDKDKKLNSEDTDGDDRSTGDKEKLNSKDTDDKDKKLNNKTTDRDDKDKKLNEKVKKIENKYNITSINDIKTKENDFYKWIAEELSFKNFNPQKTILFEDENIKYFFIKNADKWYKIILNSDFSLNPQYNEVDQPGLISSLDKYDMKNKKYKIVSSEMTNKISINNIDYN